ncbi:PMT family glycosyltransferase, 4-amino-4-deoxy-L-arabinose transferase [Xenococcus sp. PCC 7305]|nr:PMT family glycosyltransferase, 4-amino-4-deoxy-L-arabinose transferase [Xenococcus sp. PCC 7305]
MWRSLEKYPQIYGIVALVWLLIVGFIAFLWHLGATGLVDETEPLFAEAARQMTVTGNWITPYFNEVTRFDKPPLIYWLMGIGYQIMGVNEWAVRLPSAISAISLMVLGFYTLRRLGNINQSSTRSQSLLFAVIGTSLMALNLQTILWARTGVSDMLLSGCMGNALFCFFIGYSNLGNGETRDRKKFGLPSLWYLGFYILIALAVLAKGPVGIVLPGLIIFCFLLYVGQFKAVAREMNLILGAIIFLVISVPWYILVFLENGQVYLDAFFGKHNFRRFTDVVNGHDAPWYFYIFIVLGLFAPWSVYLPLAIHRLAWWRRSWWQRQPRHNHLGIFAFFWFVCIFLFFSISVTKLPSYVLPLIPAGSILVAMLWDEYFARGLAKPKKFQDQGFLISILANLLLAILFAIAFILLPTFIGKDPAIPELNLLLTKSGLTTKGAIVWGLIAIAIMSCLIRIRYWRWIIAVNLVGFVAFTSFVLLPTSFFLDVNRQLPLREIAQEIITVQRAHEPIIMLGFKKPSLVFYTQQPVQFFRRKKSLSEYITEFDADIKSDTFLLISRAKEIRKVAKLQPQDYQQLAKKGVYNLIRVLKAQFYLDIK